MIDPFSRTAYFIEMLFDKQKLASGTAFFIERDEKYYLVTNWHNVTGIDQATNNTKHSKGGIPNRLRIFIHVQEGTGKLVDIVWYPFEFNLLTDAGCIFRSMLTLHSVSC